MGCLVGMDEQHDFPESSEQASTMDSRKGDQMTNHMASATEGEMYSCQIDGRGRLVRALVGVVFLLITLVAGGAALSTGGVLLSVLAIISLVLTILMFGQAAAGKCVARAMGIDTPI